MAMDDFRSPSVGAGQQGTSGPSYGGASSVPPSGARREGKGPKLLLLLLLLVVLLGILWALSGNTLPTADPNVAIAPEGETVKNFPPSLLPEGNPYIESSYSIAYKDAGRDFPVVTYTSTKEYEATIDEFRRLLLVDGWVILKDGSVNEKPTTNFYATKAEAEVNITIEDKEAGPWVTIAYSEPR